MLKQRSKFQKMLRVTDSFKTLKDNVRVPQKYKKLIRKSTNTTFVYHNSDSYRVVNKNSLHINFIKKFNTLYSTSANQTKQLFKIDFAKANCNIEVINKNNYQEYKSSIIIKLTNHKKRKLR
jgi:tRNA A37 threonylcarbamoyladenosine synthetase subunit TsaC/SUA5/YrdC